MIQSANTCQTMLLSCVSVLLLLGVIPVNADSPKLPEAKIGSSDSAPIVKKCEDINVKRSKRKLLLRDCNSLKVVRRTESGNSVESSVSGSGNETRIRLSGRDNKVVTSQSSAKNKIVVSQSGSGNTVNVVQTNEHPATQRKAVPGKPNSILIELDQSDGFR